MTLRKMEGFETTPLAYLQTILSISGTWPILTCSQRFIRAFLISINFIFIYYMQASYFLSSDFNNKLSIIYIAYLSSSFTVGLVYYSSLLMKKIKITIYTKLLEDWINMKNTKEYDVLIEYANYSKKCTSLFIACYVFYVTFLFLQSFKSYFLDIMIPLNETRKRNLMYPMRGGIVEGKYFLEFLLLQYLAFLILGFSIASGLSMVIAFILHSCAMFRITGCLLDNILEGEIKGLKVIDNKMIYTRIIHIIQIHDRTIQYIDAYNVKSNMIHLIIITCALFFIGAATIHIVNAFENNKNEDIVNLVILPIIYIIMQLISTFMLCFIGQHLKNVSESVFYKANETSWYLMSKESKILLCLVIARANKPTYISIGNMFAASHEFFVQIVKLSMSYAMVLHSRM